MLTNLMAIALFEVAGDFVQQVAGLPIPGPVIGMALLLGALVARGRLPDDLERAASGILSCLPMLFVPAGVGVVAHIGLIRAHWPAIAAAIAVSSVLAIAVTAGTMRAIERLQEAILGRSRRHLVVRTMDAAQ